MKYKNIVWDIMGTTTPVSHTDEIREYLLNNPAVRESVQKSTGQTIDPARIREGHALGKTNKEHPLFKEYLTFSIHAQRIGYETGDLHLPLEEGVKEAFEQVFASGRRNIIFTTGDTLVTQLGMCGNGLDSKIFTYFSSKELGSKTDPASYRKIAWLLDAPPEDMAYINDLMNEAKAAKQAEYGGVVVIDRTQPGTRDGIIIVPTVKEVIRALKDSR